MMMMKNKAMIEENLNKQELLDICEKYGANNYHPLPVFLEKGKGCKVIDSDGNEYLDFLSAYSSLLCGYGFGEFIETSYQQSKKISLTSRAFLTSQYALFCRDICQFTGFEKVLPMNSGAEAVETAIKMVRRWAYKFKGVPNDKAQIIACKDNFHGRTVTIITFSSDEEYRQGYGPFTPGFKVIPYGDINALKEAITPNTAAFLVEPVQGEAGIKIPPKGYLAQAKAVCKQNNVLLVLDEIQTGFGRTGRMFAWEHDNAKPDVMILGKALGGGEYPISCVVSSAQIMSVFDPGSHGSTFGGNPKACAIARTVLAYLREHDLAGESAEKGAYFLAKLEEALQGNDKVKELRGLGLFIAIELKPEAGGARRYCEMLMEEGILCKETHRDVIRIAPPLIISKQEIDWALPRIVKVLG